MDLIFRFIPCLENPSFAPCLNRVILFRHYNLSAKYLAKYVMIKFAPALLNDSIVSIMISSLTRPFATAS